MAASNDSIFNEFFNNLTKINRTTQQIIYIGVGVASNLDTKLDNVLKDKDMHQYPPYIQQIKEQSNLPLHILLIDPSMEEIPYSVERLGLGLGTEPFNKINQNTWHNPTKQITITSINSYVIYPPYSDKRHYIGEVDDDYVDITQFLISMNELCAKHKDLLFFHDFSGRDTFLLAMTFDNSLQENRNRIVYDLSNRQMGTCTIDLTDSDNYYGLERDSNGLFYVLNPFCIKKIGLLIAYDETTNNILRIQLLTILKNELERLNKNIYYLYRRLNTIITADDFDSFRIIQSMRYFEFEYIDIKYGMNLYDLFVNSNGNKTDIEGLKDIILEIMRMEIVELAMCLDRMNSNEEFYQTIANSLLRQIDDPKHKYNWFELIKEFVREKIDL